MVTLTRERIERVKAAFTDAVDADAATRQRISERLERDDPEAAEMLRQLLRTHDDPNDDLFKEPVIRLEEALAEPANAAATVPALGKQYRIIRLLGCGGVGDVYLAEERHPISRHLAIKVFRPHRLDGTRLRRFGIEARALGSLSHPGIAQVFGAGEGADGRPFLAMEYVPGFPIDEACTKAGLDERAILKLFVELCDAVQHAHQRGIIHRDLKPSNVLAVLADGEVTVKVIDFGVAKLADEAGVGFKSLTLHGQILGTLDYMSPEQWRGGQADTRSDVYSLGVLLYRLLTQRMPFPASDSNARPATAEQIHPAPMREVPAWMRRDMETIISKALSHESTRRYASPLHMAEDIGRLLRGEPVLAKPVSLMDRAVKFLRRHPRSTVSAVILTLAALGLIVQTALSRHQLAREVELQQSMIVGILDDVLDRMYVLTGAMDTRETLANSLLDRTTQLLERSPNDPALLEAKARLLVEVGNVQRERGEDSLSLRIRAIEIFAHLTDHGLGDYETERRYADALARYGHHIGASDPTLRDAQFQLAKSIHRDLAQRHPGHPGILDDLCWSYDRIGEARWRDGRIAEAFKLFMQRLELADDLLALDPERVLSHYNLMMAHYWLARYHFEHGEDERLRHHIDHAVSYGEHSIAMDPARVHFRISFRRVLLLQAQAAVRSGDTSKAAEVFQRLDQESAPLYRSNPERTWVVRDTVRIQIEHAHAAQLFADDDRVESLYRRASELIDRHPGSLTRRHEQMMKDLRQRFAD